MRETFRTTDAGRPWTLVLEDDVVLLDGGAPFRKWSVRWSALRHVYLHATDRNGRGYDRLILSFDDDRGRVVTEIINAPSNDPSIAAAIDAIVRVRPDVDRRHLEPRAAYRLLGVTTDRRIVRIVGGFVAVCIVATASPHIVRLASLKTGGYVTVADTHAIVDRAIVETEGRANNQRAVGVWIPLIPAGAGCPRATIALHLRHPDDAARLASSTRFTGGREVLWDEPPNLSSAHERQWIPFSMQRTTEPACLVEFEPDAIGIDPERTVASDLKTVLSRILLGASVFLLIALGHKARSHLARRPARPATPYR